MEGKEEVKFTIKERRFIDEFMSCYNAGQAAMAAGYSKRSAYSIGSENLKKPDIKAEIEKRLKEKQLDAEGTKAIVSTIAKGNANRYLKVIEVEHTPLVEKSLYEIITAIENEIIFEDDFANVAEFSPKETKVHEAMQKDRRRRILRYRIELRNNPDATRMVPGDPVMVEDTVFDLVALAKDKENGIIKSFKMTKDGPQVEFCSIDGNLANLLRVHGLFDDKLEVSEKGSIPLNRWLKKNSEIKTEQE